MIRWLTTTAVSALLLTAAAPAWADDPVFGDKGQFIVSADRVMGLFDYTSAKVSGSETMGGVTIKGSESSNSSSIALLQNPGSVAASDPANVPRLSADFTVMPHLTIGGSLVVFFNPGANTTDKSSGMGTSTSTTTAAPTSTLLGIAPRVGYILGLNRYLSFWPRGGVSLYWLHNHTPDVMMSGTESISATIFQVNLEPMIVLTPASHFGITAGPTADIPLAGPAKDTTTASGSSMSTSTSGKYTLFHVGVELGLLGWF